MTLTDAQRGRLARDGARAVKVRGTSCGHVWTVVTAKSFERANNQFRCPECDAERRCRPAYEQPAKRVCSDPLRRGCRTFLSQATPLDEPACSPCRLALWDREAERLRAAGEANDRKEREKLAALAALPATASQIAKLMGISYRAATRRLESLERDELVVRVGRPGRGTGRDGESIGGWTYWPADQMEGAA